MTQYKYSSWIFIALRYGQWEAMNLRELENHWLQSWVLIKSSWSNTCPGEACASSCSAATQLFKPPRFDNRSITELWTILRRIQIETSVGPHQEDGTFPISQRPPYCGSYSDNISCLQVRKDLKHGKICEKKNEHAMDNELEVTLWHPNETIGYMKSEWWCIELAFDLQRWGSLSGAVHSDV
jgi:hypothetical protein